MNSARIAYYGTTGSLGHKFVAIRGSFTEDERRKINDIDMIWNMSTPSISKYDKYTIFGVPWSVDDGRPGSKTILLIEGKASMDDIKQIIFNNEFLKSKFKKI